MTHVALFVPGGERSGNWRTATKLWFPLLWVGAVLMAAMGLVSASVPAFGASGAGYDYDEPSLGHGSTRVLVAGPMDQAVRGASVDEGLIYDSPRW
ncbi:MAG: hypothetical protein U9R47_04475 [Actinomycetota bacterium]|nr:hypothetical protein [Actinomycetota bacterium]